ncbi:CASP-like protein [Hibiscus syriacus]|uniref:CASP-like protein n=1 Tax=Hibiscus syriacus TaxID=106335 RepID=A0A6A2XP47_HIBSY|nr:uncharacterized protein LOC120164422 [Hibiscus syriacus]KAE8677378.1 CASP-like protein [Hibiscus syriacus]
MKYNEISHFSHPQHILKFEYTEVPFKCDGCKEVGIGSHYRCSFCDFDLHMHCAIPSLSIYHPFYTKCSFQFFYRSPGDTPRYCNACEKDINGFIYHCKSCGFDFHPCCAKLPMVLDDGEVNLYLHRKVIAVCHRCGRKGRSWSYRSDCKKYNLHVACVRKLETRIPSLKNTLQTSHKRSKGKVKKCCEMAVLALQFVISAVLGDPTALTAGVIGNLMSRA